MQVRLLRWFILLVFSCSLVIEEADLYEITFLIKTQGGNHRKSLVETLDGSLKRMGIGYTDIVYVHLWEYRTPIQEVMRALDDVVRSGKALYVGISDAPAWVTASKQAVHHL